MLVWEQARQFPVQQETPLSIAHRSRRAKQAEPGRGACHAEPVLFVAQHDRLPGFVERRASVMQSVAKHLSAAVRGPRWQNGGEIPRLCLGMTELAVRVESRASVMQSVAKHLSAAVRGPAVAEWRRDSSALPRNDRLPVRVESRALVMQSVAKHLSARYVGRGGRMAERFLGYIATQACVA
jgi:hypothetical protein